MQDAYFQGVCAFLAIQILAVLGRVYVRTSIRAFGWDDLAAVITLIVASAFDCCIIAIYTTAGGAVPIQDIPPRFLDDVIYLVLAAELLYIAATALLKIALGLLLLRVLVKRWMKITIWSVMAISTIYGTLFFFIVLFQCGSPKVFARKIIIRQCLSEQAIDGYSYVHSVLQAMADLTFGTLPVIFLWNAEFTRRAKYSIGGILMLGSVGCICTFIRIGWIHYLVLPTTAYIVTARGIILFSSIELSIGLLCISLATYKPLMHRMFGRPTTYYNYDYYGGSSRTGRSWSSQHGAPEEFPVPEREHQQTAVQRSAPAVMGRDTPTFPDRPAKTWRLGSPRFDSASDLSDWQEGRAV